MTHHASRTHQPPSHSVGLAISASRSKAIAWALFGLTLTIGSIYLASTRQPTDAFDVVKRLFVIIGALVLFGGGSARAVWRAFSAAPALVVTADGIWVNIGSIKADLVPWSKIKEIGGYRAKTQSIMRIALNDPRWIPARQNLLQRLYCALLLSRMITASTIIISDSMLSLSITDVLTQVKERYQHELKRHDIRVTVPHI